MKFTPTPIAKCFLIDLEPRADERGFFSRAFCAAEMKAHELEDAIVQANNSVSVHKHTLRGLHYQLAPHQETKMVRCVRGALWDVVLDLRPHSPTFGQHFGAELSADNRRAIYVPRECAHGFLTLADDTEAIYFASAAYAPKHERGIRWNDPRFGIAWPLTTGLHISDKDANHPDFDPAHHLEMAA